MTYPLSRDFKVTYDQLRPVAAGLNRPECVLALANGKLIAANGQGGYSIVQPNGRVDHVLISNANGRKYLPNGIALMRNGRVLFADLGAEAGGIFSLDSWGHVEPVIERIGPTSLPPSNFVLNDRHGNLWFTISTQQRPRTKAWSHDVADGYIAMADQSGVRIVADGIGYTNEIAFSPDGKWLYVNETYNQRTSRFPLDTPTQLGPKEVVAQYGGADFPDGLTFDIHGGAWITCIATNRLIVIRPDGELQVVLEDTDTSYCDMLAAKLLKNELSQQDMSTAGKSRLNNISSLAFGGPNLKTAYLGCLLGREILAFDSPVAGMQLEHWKYDTNAA